MGLNRVHHLHSYPCMRCRPFRRTQGFTLIELLIVVAIIGIIASILIPNLLDAMQKAKQKRTMADMKLIGTSWFSWLTDQVGAAAAGSSQNFDWGQINPVDYTDVVVLLEPIYTAKVPRLDGWNQEFEFGLSENLEDALPLALRSSGNDNSFTSGSYTSGPFVGTDYRQDIVWAGGYFLRWPGTR